MSLFRFLTITRTPQSLLGFLAGCGASSPHAPAALLAVYDDAKPAGPTVSYEPGRDR